MGERKVVFVTDGKDAKTVAAFAEYILSLIHISEPTRPY